MPPFVGGQAGNTQTGGNLPVTSLSATLGGLALQRQPGALLAVSEAAPIQTQGQRQLMAQAASPQLPVVMGPPQVMPQQLQQQNRPRPVAGHFEPIQQMPKALRSPVQLLMQIVAQPQQKPSCRTKTNNSFSNILCRFKWQINKQLHTGNIDRLCRPECIGQHSSTRCPPWLFLRGQLCTFPHRHWKQSNVLCLPNSSTWKTYVSKHLPLRDMRES